MSERDRVQLASVYLAVDENIRHRSGFDTSSSLLPTQLQVLVTRQKEAHNLVNTTIKLHHEVFTNDFDIEKEKGIFEDMICHIANDKSLKFLNMARLISYKVLLDTGILNNHQLKVYVEECWDYLPLFVKKRLTDTTISDIVTTQGIQDMIENAELND